MTTEALTTSASSTSLQMAASKTTTTRAAARDVITKRVNWHSPVDHMMIYIALGTIAAITLLCIKCGCIITLVKHSKKIDQARINGYALVPQSELNSSNAPPTIGPPFSS